LGLPRYYEILGRVLANPQFTVRGKIIDLEKCVDRQDLSIFWMKRVVPDEETVPERFYSLQEFSTNMCTGNRLLDQL
jgi:hypothetical protein